jgi:DNA-directed RNA polymerase subunit M/transcription elongation factor TFIIS
MMARPSTWTAKDLALAIHMRDSGASYSAIGAALGKTRHSVRYALIPEARIQRSSRSHLQVRACPKCRHGVSRVLTTSRNTDGMTVRHCACESCGHKFFTAQEPEFLVPRHAVKWTKIDGGGKLQLVEADG